MRRVFVVVGTGRSGTGFVCHALRGAGIHCGHEQVIGPHNALAGGLDWSGHAGDASWLAVPRLPIPGVTAVLVTRHPLTTVRSMTAIGQWATGRGDTPYGQVVAAHRPQVYTETNPEDRALAMWLLWTWAALPYVAARHRVETLDLPQLVADLGLGSSRDVGDIAAGVDLADLYATNPWAANRKPNEKPSGDGIIPDWGTFRRPLALAARELAVTLGYDPDRPPAGVG